MAEAHMTPAEHAARAAYFLAGETLISRTVEEEPYIAGRESVPAILAAVAHAVLALRPDAPAVRMPDGEQALGRLVDELAGARASRAEALEDVERLEQSRDAWELACKIARQASVALRAARDQTAAERDELLAQRDGLRLEIAVLKVGKGSERAKWEQVLAVTSHAAELWHRRAILAGWQPEDADLEPPGRCVPAPRDGDATDGGAP